MPRNRMIAAILAMCLPLSFATAPMWLHVGDSTSTIVVHK